MKMDPTLVFEITRNYVHDAGPLLGPELSGRILGWIRGREISHLASCSDLLVLKHSKNEQELLRVLMQIEAFFKKNAVFSRGEECWQACLQAFERGERLCRISNRRLTHYFVNRGRLDPDVDIWMSRMENTIGMWLGDYSLFIEALPRLIRFTSGATASSPRRDSFPAAKVSLRPAARKAAEPYLNALAKYFGHSGKFKVRPAYLNRLEKVPKNWKTDRMIACEPEGHLVLQLAFDTFAKRRLRRVGVDLSDQSRNREMAKEGSLSGKYATIDLSMASDTVSRCLVEWLLPEPFFKYLNAVRTPCGRLPNGKVVQYAKFSSMGNGATFALETLIFAAACKAVGSKDFSVYGDDIIIETELVPKLYKLLRFLGFLPNPDKSFTDGPFRESCGGNFYKGSDITPFFLRSLDHRKAARCHNINGLASIALPYGSLWKQLNQLRKEWKLPFVPFSESSISGVWVDPDTALDLKLYRNRGWKRKVKAFVPLNQTRYLGDSRCLFLWHLRANGFDSVRDSGYHIPGTRAKNEIAVQSSRVPLPSHKYVRKWVHWFNPVAAAPAHLYGWADYMLRES